MFRFMNTELAQPKPIKAYDLHEALNLFQQTNTEHHRHVVSDIPTRIPRAAKPEALDPADESVLPHRLKAVGGPVSGAAKVALDAGKRGGMLKDSWKVMATEKQFESEKLHSIGRVYTAELVSVQDEVVYGDFWRLSSPPLPPHKRHSKMTSFSISSDSFDNNHVDAIMQSGYLSPSYENRPFTIWTRAPSASQVPYPPSWASEEGMDETEYPQSPNSYVEEWVMHTQAFAQQWVRPPVSYEEPASYWGPAPSDSGLARIMAAGGVKKVEAYLEGGYSSDEEFETASEGSGSRGAGSDLQAISASSSCSVLSSNESFHGRPIHRAEDQDSVDDSGYASNQLYIPPSSSTNDLRDGHYRTEEMGESQQASNHLHWNISMGGDAVSFLLKAERDLQAKANVSAQASTTGDVPKLHWNWTMGGDAVSFLWNAECKLQKRMKERARALSGGV